MITPLFALSAYVKNLSLEQIELLLNYRHACWSYQYVFKKNMSSVNNIIMHLAFQDLKIERL